MAKAETLVDNFNDNSLDTVKWYAVGDPLPITDRVREVNGRIEITPRSGEGPRYSGFRSVKSYDLLDSYALVELVQAPRPIGKVQTFFAGRINGGTIAFNYHDGYMECFQDVGTVTTQLYKAPYDPVAHRWLRLRETQGTTFWEVSPDGRAWTVLVSKPDPITLTNVYFYLEVGVRSAIPSPGMAIYDNFNVIDSSRSRRIEERRRSALDVRVEAAEVAAARLHPEHTNNNDEVNYGSFIGNFSKSLKHDSLGDPDPKSYGTLLRALQSEDPADFEEIELSTVSNPVKLTNPQSGLAFDIAGPDPQEMTMRPAPRFDSEQAAHEMGELYWMALARDVPFIDWPTQATTTNSVIQRAIASLSSEFPAYGGTSPVTTQTLFRGIYPGEQEGPYVSQFLLKGNIDQRKPNTQGLDADEGFVSYGAQGIDQRISPAKTGVDYLKSFTDWLDVQNGVDKRGLDQFETPRRFIRSLRDGATYVHFDQVINAYYNAAWILMSEPTGNQLTFQSGITGRPQIDLEFPKNLGNPYDPPGTANDSRTQVGFATFGPIHLMQVLNEVLARSLRAVWWQKWGVHRRLRPEEYGGRVHNHLRSARTYPLHSSILTSLQSGQLSNYFNSTTGYLLPQAYPEGAPTHPAYGAGHATGSGACATILKAFFDESKTIENPVQASADGSALVPYTGLGTPLTVGGELNKLAGNIALFRDAGGVHWRSDYTESLILGEAVAIALLQEMTLGFNEDDAYFEFTRFDEWKVRIFDGRVVATHP